MEAINRIIASLLSFLLSFFGVTSFKTEKRAENLRVVSYIVANDLAEGKSFDESHLNQLTDIIFFGQATFDEEGKIHLTDDFDYKLDRLKSLMEENGSQANLYVNLLGPGGNSEGTTWEEQQEAQSIAHEKAFTSGVLEQNIITLLKEKGFDGVFFDYEYPEGRKHWKPFEQFLISLDDVLGDEYLLGAAVGSWNVKLSPKGIKTLDMVEVMCYDFWNNKGIHAPMSLTRSAIVKVLSLGFKRSQIDVGIPFYARPTTQEAYWYSYNGWYDKLDDEGLAFDEETGLTFSFNDYDTVYDKTKKAIKNGLGGVFVWHYSCDVNAGNEKSLFNAITQAKSDYSK